MRKVLIMLAGPALLATALPALAQNSQQPSTQENSAQPQNQASAQVSEERICVTERLSGSRMPRRICRTAREWQAIGDGRDDR